ncbi:MAG: hypothetical protein ACRD3L_03210 [Terriglobales bacterium]
MRHRHELIGETLREIGILLLVFVPLDATFYQGEIRWAAMIGLFILGVSGVALIAAGIVLEGG